MQAIDRGNIRLVVILAATALLLALVFTHAPHVNGPWYWPWPWRRLASVRVIALMGFVSIPVLFAFYFAGRRGLPVWGAIGLIMFGSFAMRLSSAAVLSEPMSLDFVRRATVHPLIGSYYSSAAKLAPFDNILSTYWELLNWDSDRPHLDFHAVNKPPGPVLYYLFFIRALGDSASAALWSGLGLGILATLAIPCTYLLTRRITESEEAGLIASTWLSLAPGFVLFFPMTDPAYAVFTCLLALTWFCALKENRWYWSALFGAGLFASTFANYSTLVVGVFLAGMIFIVPSTDTPGEKLTRRFKHACIAAASCGGAYLILYVGWAFNPVITFFAAYKAQSDLISTSPRSRIFPQTIPWDLYDCLLGVGWIAFLPILFFLIGRDWKSPSRRLAALGLVQLLVTAATGLLQAETARVWNFLFPLLLLSVGLELEKWPRWKVTVVLACVAALTIAIHINMTFINEG
jgi:hypothetical protein